MTAPKRPLPETIFRTFGHHFGSLIYRIRRFGQEQLPAEGFLLLPNHLTWVDAIILQIACPRPIRFVIDEAIYQRRMLQPILKLMGTLPISAKRSRHALQDATEAIRRGEVVCIFPEGELSRTGQLLRLKRGYELIARAAECPVVPVWLDGLWGSIFSFQGGRFFFKLPKQFPYAASVAFGAPIPAEEASIALVRERFLELGEFCYQRRPALQEHLSRACVRGLKKRPWSTAIVDGADGSTLSRGSLLAAGIALSRRLRAQGSGARIGVVLPASKGAIVANLAVALARKTPVNLNFTAGRNALVSALETAEIRQIITATPVQKKLPEFPWTDDLLVLDRMLPELKGSIIRWRIAVALLPGWALAWLLGLPRRGDHAEAMLLFTSGSAGAPKGVVLSHRNLVGNVSQFATILNLHQSDTILANLPFFHSFGATVTLWYPLIEGFRVITYPSPLEIAKNAELIRKHRITLLCSTPTFLRGYLRKAEPAQMESLSLIVTGAEKLPKEVAEAFRERFGKEIMQGYGLTETAPVASVNLPDPVRRRPEEVVQSSSREGSVGKLAPGMAAQIRDPETGEHRSLHETGMLWLKGPNIFEGYLGDPERTAEVLQEGWFKTGDLGRFDEDGFLFIEGRLTRFSKIGGEMVPHETIESRLYELLELPKEERVITITSVPDAAKGEALVLLTTRDLEAGAIRTKLAEAGLPNLWIPKKVLKVEAIPVLASGKLDLQGCRQLAEKEAQGS